MAWPTRFTSCSHRRHAPERSLGAFPFLSRLVPRAYISFNFRRKPWDDVRVRRAINMAIDRPVLVDRALLGYGLPALGLYIPAIPWAYNAAATVPAFDVAGAEKLLDEAGLTRDADGARLKPRLLSVPFSPFGAIAQVLQEQLRGVGIEADVILLTGAEWTQSVYDAKDFDLALTDGTHGPDPDRLNGRFGSRGAANCGAYTNADFDSAMADGARQTRLEDRAKAYFHAQEILARDLPFAPLVDLVQFIITRDNVTGLPQAEARGWVTFHDYSLVRVKR